MRATPLRPPASRVIPAFVVVLHASLALAQAVPPNVIAALEHPSPRVRITAIVAISKSQDPNARRYLEGMLGDAAEPVRAAAVEGLDRLGDPAAIPALDALKNDKSALVKKAALAAIASLEARRRETASAPAAAKGAILVELRAANDYSGRAPEGTAEKLRDRVSSALASERRRAVRVESAGVKQGYGVLPSVRRVQPFSQGGVNGLEVRCELTVVELPSNALRLSLTANAGAGVEGKLDPRVEKELVDDAVEACAPALAKDFLDWVVSR